jgi:glycosyltransferase involved in cell wall biosynthesis
MSKRLLCISYRFPPETYALAIRVKYFLNHLRREGWKIDAVTAASEAVSRDGLTVHHVSPRTPDRLLEWARSLQLDKLIDWFVWPDPYVFWVLPAYRRARRMLQDRQYDGVVVFMMPHSTGLVGLLLRRETELPLILNMNDSLTCSDMNPEYPSKLHYRLAEALEDKYVQSADAAIYVSKRNLERVRDRQPPEHRDKFHLIRRGTKRPPAPETTPRDREGFRIGYVGGTGGWYEFLDSERSPSLLKRLYRACRQLTTYTRVELDPRTHGPVYVGQAVQQVLNEHPSWTGRIHVDVYGKRFPEPVTNAVLDKFELHDIVHLHGPVPHEEALQKMAESDLLFMALPDRPDGSPGGRISAKTYEYLMTDRPILAALPPGENREYLEDKPGIHLVDPKGVNEMTKVIARLASDHFDGSRIMIDRSVLYSSLSSTARSQAFERVVAKAVTDDLPVEDVLSTLNA